MLHKAKNLKAYELDSLDGEMGKVKDFYFDDRHWTIRYLIVDTRNWWRGKKVLISPCWIDRVSWNESKVFIGLPRETITQSPEYSEESLITRDYETALHRHDHLEGYWVEGEADSPRNAP